MSERTLSHPAEAIPTASAVRGEGSTVLSVAVRLKAPIQVIQKLLAANFHQIGVKHVARGSVLHEALKHRADDDVLDCLVRAAIEYDSQLAGHETSCLLNHKDELGRTALHYMVDRIVRYLDQGRRSQANWHIVRMLVQAYPASVSTIDADGNTPLVLMLLIPKFTCDADGLEFEEEVFRIVQLMVALCPKAVNVLRRLPLPWHYQFNFQNQASVVHGQGLPSPLSCALLHGRSVETIDLLLHANRRIGARGCRTVVTHNREVPLHIAVTMRRSVDLLAKVIQEDQRAIGVTDMYGLTPLDWMWIRHTLDWCSSSDPFTPVMVSRRRYINNHFLEWHERVSNQYLGVDKPLEDSTNPFVKEMAIRLREDVLKRISVILPTMAEQYMENNSDNMVDVCGESFPLVHAACYVNCPLALLQVACSAFPEQLCSKDPQLKRLPLHYAANRSGYAVQYPIGVSPNTKYMEEVSPIDFILSKFPEACRVTDGTQQIPLHIAINRVKDDETKQRDALQENSKVDIKYRDVEMLLQSYPESLQRRNGISKLYPFQQAAEGSNSCLELTYFLLRRDPSLVRMGLQ